MESKHTLPSGWSDSTGSQDSFSTSFSSSSRSSNYPKRMRTHTRRTHKKSHLGCQACKKRRIKCDETLPKCGPCSRIKISCSYTDMTPDEIDSMIARKNKIEALNRTEALPLHKISSIKIIDDKGFSQPLIRPLPSMLPISDGPSHNYSQRYDSPNFGHQPHPSVFSNQANTTSPVTAEFLSSQKLTPSNTIENNSNQVLPKYYHQAPSAHPYNPLPFLGMDSLRASQTHNPHHSPILTHDSPTKSTHSSQSLPNNVRLTTPAQPFPVVMPQTSSLYTHPSTLSSTLLSLPTRLVAPNVSYELPARTPSEFSSGLYSQSQQQSQQSQQSQLLLNSYLQQQQKLSPYPLELSLASERQRLNANDYLQPQLPPKQLLQFQPPAPPAPSTPPALQQLKPMAPQYQSQLPFIASASVIQRPQILSNGKFEVVPISKITSYQQTHVKQVPAYDSTIRNKPKSTLSQILNSPPSQTTPPEEKSQSLILDRPINGITTDVLVRSGFDTEMLKRVYRRWTSDNIKMASSFGFLYHAMNVLHLSFEFQNPKLACQTCNKASKNKIDEEIARERFFATQGFLLEMPRAQNHNCDALVSTALILSWTTLLTDGDDVREYFATTSRLLGAVLAAYESSINPCLNSKAVGLFESLFQNIRNFNNRPYNTIFWTELVAAIENIAPFYVDIDETNQQQPQPQEEPLQKQQKQEQQEKEQQKQQKQEQLRSQYNYLRDFVARVTQVVNGPDAQRIKPGCENLSRYSPYFLYKILREWIRNFPSNALIGESLNEHGQEDRGAKLLYNFYRATTRALDAIFPEVRYLFQMGFVGPIDQTESDSPSNIDLNPWVSHENDFLGELSPDMKVVYDNSLRYCSLMINFFRERLFFWNRFLTKTTHPLKSLDFDLSTIINLRDQFWLTIHEVPIFEFMPLCGSDLSDYLPREVVTNSVSDPDGNPGAESSAVSSSISKSSIPVYSETATGMTTATVTDEVTPSHKANILADPPTIGEQGLKTETKPPADEVPKANHHIWAVFNKYCEHRFTELDYYVQ